MAGPSGSDQDFANFATAARSGANIVPLVQRLFSDQLTPVLAYRCLVKEDDQEAPSFLFESVVNGDQQGRCEGRRRGGGGLMVRWFGG